MKDLLDALQAAGWRLLDGKNHPRASADPFTLEDDRITWALASSTGALRELEFYAFADLGQRTEKLRDVLYCVDRTTNERLYFSKRDGAEWRMDLPRFVSLIGAAADD